MSIKHTIAFVFAPVILTWSASGAATTDLKEFKLSADGHVEIILSVNGTSTSLQTDLRNDSTAEVSAGGLNVALKSYFSAGIVTVVIATSGHDIAELYLVESASQRPLNTAPILGRQATMQNDLDGILTELDELAGWGKADAFHKVQEYFAKYPVKQLSDLYDDIELGDARVFGKPKAAASTIPGSAPQQPAKPRPLPRPGSVSPLPPGWGPSPWGPPPSFFRPFGWGPRY